MTRRHKNRKSPKQTVKPDLPSDANVARYCNYQRVLSDPQTQQIISIVDALKLRTNIQENELSVLWFEKCGQALNNCYKGALQSFRKRIQGNVTKDCVVSVLRVGEICRIGQSRSHSLRVRDKSKPAEPAYAHVENMPVDNSDTILLDLLSDEGLLNFHRVKDIDLLP